MSCIGLLAWPSQHTCVIGSHLLHLQVTTDWLTTDMQEGLLDERIWKELVADCGLDPCERPQVPYSTAHVFSDAAQTYIF